MTNRLFLALACVLLAVRLPSLVQPMGADQGLYAYAGDRALHHVAAYIVARRISFDGDQA